MPPTPLLEETSAEGSICRYCLDVGDEPLQSVCACRGSQHWVHAACLRKWQISVLTSVNHPLDVSSEQRHLVCNVCKEQFHGVTPMRRVDLVAALACVTPESIQPGILLRYENMFRASDTQDEAMRILLEAKRAHFKSSVYLITSVEPHKYDGDDDAVFGVNLVRNPEATWSLHRIPLSERTRGILSQEQISEWQSHGVRVELGLGGPVNTRKPGPAVLVSPHEPEGWTVGELFTLATQAVAAACKGSNGVGNTDRNRAVLLRIFFGHARWSRTQLLGELARGSWGAALTSPARPEDLQALPNDGSDLWSALEGQPGRLHRAPKNTMREEYERQLYL